MRCTEKSTLKPLTFGNTHENNAPEGQNAIHRKLNRLLSPAMQTSWVAPDENGNMITRVIVRPNPFESSIALEVTCVQSKHIIVRITDEEERIVKMFGWFVVKGDNVTIFNEDDTMGTGCYNLDVMDLDGELLFSTELIKG